MDRFRTMESFVRVARAGSFTVAANQLGLSRALISRHIGSLEARLGVRLLNRSTRSLSLTDEGAAYLAFCERTFRDIENNEHAILRATAEPAGTLRLMAPKSFGAMHLSDAVVAFAKGQPRLRTMLVLENAPWRGNFDLVERGLDIVLSFNSLVSASLTEEEIARVDWALVASPDYLARAGRPQAPGDLTTHACLVHSDAGPSDNVWRFEGARGPLPVKVRGAFFSNSAIVLRKAAARGMGITMVPRYSVAEDLNIGRLVSVLPRHRIAPKPLLAIYPRSPAVPRKVRVFIDFLKDWMAAQDFSGLRRDAAE